MIYYIEDEDILETFSNIPNTVYGNYIFATDSLLQDVLKLTITDIRKIPPDDTNGVLGFLRAVAHNSDFVSHELLDYLDKDCSTKYNKYILTDSITDKSFVSLNMVYEDTMDWINMVLSDL